MQVDSYKYIPKSFHSKYQNMDIGDPEPVWAPFSARLADSSISLLTTGGLYVEGEHHPFDLESERKRPTWGDPSFRLISTDLDPDRIRMAHLHVNNKDILEDSNIALPIEVLSTLESEGHIGRVSPKHVSVMGYLGPKGAEAWEDSRGGIIDALKSQETDGLVLAPI